MTLRGCGPAPRSLKQDEMRCRVKLGCEKQKPDLFFMKASVYTKYKATEEEKKE